MVECRVLRMLGLGWSSVVVALQGVGIRQACHFVFLPHHTVTLGTCSKTRYMSLVSTSRTSYGKQTIG